ncbi:hypothetical protein [uncultured Jannaschia sp.]|uniref:hypothetical protein n=1 Tax=uncultured Jannaschia sp. TaxID=293347 RepID=UPI00261E1C30|nr:hypothetical protein [uncultured Jannaschia sp.]
MRPTPTGPAEAETGSGIPRDSLYRLPEGVLRATRTWPLERDALRLLHVLICRACRDWRQGTDPQPPEGYGEAFRDIHGWQGTRPNRGNGRILAAMAQLRATGAFEEIEARHGNRALHWRFTNQVYVAFFCDDVFGYLDIRILPHLRDALTLRLLGEIALAHGMERPVLELDVEDLHRMGGLAGPVCWKTVRRSFLSTLQTVGALHGLRIILCLSCEDRHAGIDLLHIRVEHARTNWSTSALGRLKPSVREVIVMDRAGERRMRPDALPACLRGRRRMPA